MVKVADYEAENCISPCFPKSLNGWGCPTNQHRQDCRSSVSGLALLVTRFTEPQSLWYFVMGQTFTFMTVVVSARLLLVHVFWSCDTDSYHGWYRPRCRNHGILYKWMPACLRPLLTRQELLLRVKPLKRPSAIPMAIVEQPTAGHPSCSPPLRSSNSVAGKC